MILSSDITSFADHLSDIIFFLDRNGTILYANHSSLRILGFLSEELVGRDLLSLLDPVNREWLISACSISPGSAKTWYQAGTGIQTKDGRYLSCDINYQVQDLPDGYAVLVIARKQETPAISGIETDSSRDLLTIVLDSMLDGVVIVSDTGAVLYANAAALMVGGLSPGTDCCDLNIFSFLDEESQRKAKEDLIRVIHGDSLSVAEYRFRNKNSPLEWIEAIGTQIQVQGKPADLVSFRDIAAKKRAEEELELLRERYATIVREAPEPIIVHSQGIVTFVNDAGLRASGYEREEIVGNHVSMYLTESSQKVAMEAMKSRESGNPIHEYEVDFVTKSGSILHLLVKNTVILYDKEPHVLLFITDITRRKHLEEALRQANRKIHLLNRITRHDISNKVSSLEAYCLMMQEESLSPRVITTIRSMEQTIDLIKNQIQFFRTYQNLGVHDPEWIDLRTVLQDCIKTVVGLSCTPVCEIPPVQIYADPLVERVFFNLLDNAVRHGETVSTIMCVWQEKENCGVITFCDDGTGVDEEEKEKIFLEGYGKNSGLGLFLTREILAITGITIKETGKPGSGARFEIIVPVGMYRDV